MFDASINQSIKEFINVSKISSRGNLPLLIGDTCFAYLIALSLNGCLSVVQPPEQMIFSNVYVFPNSVHGRLRLNRVGLVWLELITLIVPPVQEIVKIVTGTHCEKSLFSLTSVGKNAKASVVTYG